MSVVLPQFFAATTENVTSQFSFKTAETQSSRRSTKRPPRTLVLYCLHGFIIFSLAPRSNNPCLTTGRENSLTVQHRHEKANTDVIHLESYADMGLNGWIKLKIIVKDSGQNFS